MDLNSSELPDEIKKILKDKYCEEKKVLQKTENIPTENVLEIHGINDRDFTRYEILYYAQY